MLRIDNTIFSLDILERKFKCNLPECFGNCCRYGDSGAPLSDHEVKILDDIWPDIKGYLTPEGIRVIEEKGTSISDFENERVTPLIKNEECAYTTLDGGILFCGIEKAWIDGKVDFQKPLSCHLFPIRIKHFSDFMAVNYQELPICSSARETGSEEGVYVYQFLKGPLIRALGEDMYGELCTAAKELKKSSKRKR